MQELDAGRGAVAAAAGCLQTLLAQGLHQAYEALPGKLPLHKALASRLAQALSQLAHWCPVFGEQRTTRHCVGVPSPSVA